MNTKYIRKIRIFVILLVVITVVLPFVFIQPKQTRSIIENENIIYQNTNINVAKCLNDSDDSIDCVVAKSWGVGVKYSFVTNEEHIYSVPVIINNKEINIWINERPELDFVVQMDK